MKTLVRLGVLVAVLAALAAGFARHDARARSAAGAIVDRTLACTVLPAGTGAIGAQASPRIGTTNATPAWATLTTGNGGGINLEGTEILAVYTKGAVTTFAEVRINTKLCHTVRIRVPLTPGGLIAGPPHLGGHATCLTARQVFLHLRATMASRPTWTSNPPFQVTHANPLSAEIAVQSQKRKPLVFMTIEGQKARFYSARNCF